MSEEEKSTEKVIENMNQDSSGQDGGGETSINIKKSTLWQMISGLFAILFVISLFTGGFRGNDGGTGTVVRDTGIPKIQPSPPTQRPPTGIVDVGADDDPVKGDPNAPVTIIEFSDFECPFCGRFYTQTLPQIEEQYIKTGKVKLVYRDFPLSFHANAQVAAEAAGCADEQGKFWEMHDQIFSHQQLLSESNLKKWAADLGLNVDEFNSCLDSGDRISEIQGDLNEGQAAGVTGTPGFFVNGRLIVGAQPFSVFQQAIDAELA